LLSEAGITFDIAASDVDETPLPDEPPAEYVGRVALAKASVPALDDDMVVLAADTAVIVDSTILGKPHDAARATAMLELLSGRWHDVMTAVVVRWRGFGGEHVLDRLVTTAVEMESLDAERIAAYAIQERGQALVARVHGSGSNVVGLPVDETLAMLDEVPGWRTDGTLA
jgi:septum formation protein